MGPVRVQVDRRRVHVGDREVALTATEFDAARASHARAVPGVHPRAAARRGLGLRRRRPAPARSTSTSPSCAPSSATPARSGRCAAPATPRSRPSERGVECARPQRDRDASATAVHAHDGRGPRTVAAGVPASRAPRRDLRRRPRRPRTAADPTGGAGRRPRWRRGSPRRACWWRWSPSGRRGSSPYGSSRSPPGR